MSRPAKYSFHLSPDGIVRLARSDGAPIDEDQVNWFRRITSEALKAEALAKSRTHVRAAEQAETGEGVGETRAGVRFEIDPAIGELEEVRDRLGFKRAPVARAATLQPQSLTDYVRGASRPDLSVLRSWAAVLGRQLLLVPTELAPRVVKMVRAWEAENEKGEEEPAA